VDAVLPEVFVRRFLTGLIAAFFFSPHAGSWRAICIGKGERYCV
jgi:hypothetical protein